MRRELLIDFSWLWTRSLYAFKELTCVVDDKTVCTGAMYGILKFIQSAQGMGFDTINICLDDYSKYRTELFEGYKATREHGDPFRAEARKLNPELFQVLGYVGCRIIKVEGMEADDVISSMALELANNGDEAVIYSSDKDMQQLLVFPNIKMANKIENGNLLYITEEQVEEKLDVKPELVRYYRPFRGDSSDNISSAATRVQSKYLKPVAESIRTNLLQGNTLDMAYDKAVVQHIATLSANALSTIQSGKNIYIRNFCLMDLLKYNKNPLEISYVSLPALNQSGFLEILNKYQMNEFKKYYFETLSALGVGNALQD